MLPSMSSRYILLSKEIELLKSFVVFESSFLNLPFQSCMITSVKTRFGQGYFTLPDI